MGPRAQQTKAGDSEYAYPLASGSGFDGGVADHMARAFGNWMSDNAVDIYCRVRTPVIAVADGTVSEAIDHSATYNPAANPNGSTIYLNCEQGNFAYMHLISLGVKTGDKVTKGQEIGLSGEANSVAHLHFAAQPPLNPEDVVSGVSGTGSTSGPAQSTGDVGQEDLENISKAAAFSTFLELPGLLDSAESMALRGERSLLNDKPLLPFVEQLTKASLRSFQSMPNGKFFAFYPDYFGGLNHRTPYWEIRDIEIIDAEIDLSDDALATHVYVIGDTINLDGTVDLFEEASSAGVVTVFNAFMADFITGSTSPLLADKDIRTKDLKRYESEIAERPTLADKQKAIGFLQKYGARPLKEPMPMIRSHYYEMFLAYQTFCLTWSKQFLTRFSFTFMPELFPGGIVSFPEHGIQCYVDEVTHSGTYEAGFTTQANLSAPAALGKSGNKPWASQGMVRAGSFGLAV